MELALTDAKEAIATLDNTSFNCNESERVIQMATKIEEMKWQLYKRKKKYLTIWGLKNGYIAPYNDALIEKLRKVYYGGIPASVILLSNGMTNGHCYDRALLLSRAFLDDEDDVQLIYATVDGIKLNPGIRRNGPLYADHCIVERTIKTGQHIIYDTSMGLIYDKELYWLMEHPRVRKTNSKESIKKFIEEDEDRFTEDVDSDKYTAPLILPMIEATFGRGNEMYSQKGIELLQREIEHYKKTINYDALVEEIDQDMKRLRLRKQDGENKI